MGTRASHALLTGLVLGWVAAASDGAQAHGVWVAQRAGLPAVVMGKGPEDLAYDPRRVTRLQGFDMAGGSLAIERRDSEASARFAWTREIAAVALEFRPGPWVRLKDGRWRRGLLAPGESGAQYDYVRHGVHLFRTGAARVAPARLAIVPVDDPLSTPRPASIRVRVLFEGRPLAGKAVIADYVVAPSDAAGRTDDDGLVNVVLRDEGLHVIMVMHSEAGHVSGAQATVVHSATLSFVRPFAHDGRLQDPFERSSTPD